MSKCKSCNSNIPDKAKFCPECGASNSAELGSNAERKKVVLADVKSDLAQLDVKITSVEAVGPDRDNNYDVTVKYMLANRSKEDIGHIFVTTQLFGSHGAVIAESHDTHEQLLDSGDSEEFEVTLWGASAPLLGDFPDKGQALVSAIGSTGNRIKIYSGDVASDELVAEVIQLPDVGTEAKLLTGSTWRGMPDDDGDVYVESKVLLQNLSSTYFPQVKLYAELLDRRGESIDTYDSYEEVLPYSVATVFVSPRSAQKALKGAKLELDMEIFRQTGFGYGQSDRMSITAAELDDSSEDESGAKRIYIKTEPGGRVLSGRLTDEDGALLKTAVKNQEMSSELLELRWDSSGDFRECEGVFNQGDEGDTGNEGIIEFDWEGPIEIPKDPEGQYEDGAYIVYLSLSKVSTEFEFVPSDGEFDADKFVEVSVPVRMPDFIQHDLYGHPDYNVVVNYKYDGEEIEEYSRELVDRGYDDLTAFIIVENGVATLVYSNYNGEERWR